MSDNDEQRHALPWCYNAKTNEVTTIDVGREQVVAAGFLDARAGFGGALRRIRVDDIETPSPSSSPAWLFHSGFCCSTLICRCLDKPRNALALKEPQILIDVSSAQRQSGVDDAFGKSFDQIASALSAPFLENERTIIKPSNGANNLLDPVLTRIPDAPVLTLYSDLRSFLISILKRGQTGAQFVRMLADHPWGDMPTFARLFADNAAKLTDLKVAAMVWHLQISAFAAAATVYPTRVRTLDSAVFQRDPAAALNAIDQFFELDLGAGHIDNVIAGPLFRKIRKILVSNSTLRPKQVNAP